MKRNHVDRISDQMRNMAALRTLNLRYNNLTHTSIPPEIFENEELTTLGMYCTVGGLHITIVRYHSLIVRSFSLITIAVNLWIRSYPHPQPADPNPDLRPDFRNLHFKGIFIVCTGITYGTVRYVPVLYFLGKAYNKTLKAMLQPQFLPYTSFFFWWTLFWLFSIFC